MMRASCCCTDILSLAVAFPSLAQNFIRRSISSRCNGRNRAVFHRRPQQFGVCKAASEQSHTVVAFDSRAEEQTKNIARRGRGRAAISSESGGSSTANYVVVNFYRFVFFQDPESEINRHLEFLEDLDIRGRIYINEQGINAQYSGPSKDALSYVKWLKEDERFSDILVQVSPALCGHAFPKLKVQFKSLVQLDLEGGISNLPLLDPSMRATSLAPSEWKKKLEDINTSSTTSTGNPNPDRILLDVRNGYEWDIGHFREAKRLEVDCFRSTSFGLSESEVISSDPLADVDKEKTEILMYCTGGIRCDVYSTILRNKGFKNLYTLEGGVSHYLENEGPVDWVGNLFVFDSRLSLPPSTYKPEAATTEAATTEAFAQQQQALEKDKFAKCYICGSLVHELRHRNCANIDCNHLFLCCPGCMESLRGCCCPSCTTAPRLRPALRGHQRYQKWHVYRDLEVQPN